MERAAAILVQTLFNSNGRMQTLLKDQTVSNPQAAAEFLKPWYQAMLTMIAGIAQGLNVVKVSVTDVRVEHEVRLMDFTKWLDKTGGSPREVSDRYMIRSILGMPASR